jgi:hypothetical protein
MVQVNRQKRQKSFHKPNGSLETRKKMAGRGGGKMRKVIVEPYIIGKTKSMKKVYAELRRSVPAVSKEVSNEKRNQRLKLAKSKMLMHEKSKSIGRKVNHAQHRPRRVIWDSDKRTTKRYKYTK